MSNKTIIRGPHNRERPYFCMSRAAAQDKRLSLEARGLMAYLLSKPDDWEISPADIQREGGWGRDKTRRVINELKEHGYLVAEQTRTKEANGKEVYGPNEYFLVENPQMTDFQSTENQSTESQSTENPHQHSTESWDSTKHLDPGSPDSNGDQDSQSTENNTPRAPTRAGAQGDDPPVPSSNGSPDTGELSQGAPEEIEDPPRRSSKASPKPPARKKRPPNLRFEAMAYYGWSIMPGGPYGKQTSARIGKALKELDESFAPPLEACDIANAYVHSIRAGNIPARDPVALVAMIHTWIKEGKRDYNPNNRPADEPRDPAPEAGRSPADAYRRAGQPVPEGLDDA